MCFYASIPFKAALISIDVFVSSKKCFTYKI